MASEWPFMKLRAANVILIDCDHRTPPAAASGYPYVAIPQLQEGHINLGSARLITREHYLEWTKKAKPCANDVILSRRCNPGETAVAPPDSEFALGQNLVLLRADGTKIYPSFLRWLVRGPEWWEQINKFINVGAVFDSLKCADIPNFELQIPSLPEQRTIAGILGALDDKIELNRRMNDTLESIARAVFRHWFVENVEVGKWEIGRLENLIKINESSISKDYPYGEIEYIDISSVTTGHLKNTTTYSLVNAPSRARRLVKHGDTIWSTVRPNRKSFLFISSPKDNLVVSTGFVVLSPDKIPPSFLYYWVTTDEFVDYLVSNADGSAYPAVLPERFAEAEIPLPPKDILDDFENIVGVTLARIAQNEKESRTLASLRDSLLPKLMRGEVRVKEVEKMI